MRLLWQSSWIEAPSYRLVERGRLVRVDASLPITSLGNVSGRSYPHPYRKSWRFLLRDGPVSTLRKARSKLAEREMTGDYHVTAVLGTCVGSGSRVAALACRTPASADYLLVHERLAVDVEPSLSRDEFARWAAVLAGRSDELEALGRQTYLYSGQEPPEQLLAILEEAAAALRSETVPAVHSAAAEPVVPPSPQDERDASTAMWTGSRSRTRTRLPVALLGAGDYARTEIIPALRRARLELAAVADREPQIAAKVAARHGFKLATTDPELAIASLPGPGLVVVATAHDSHAPLTAAALHAGHHVLLEKPAVITQDDLELLTSAAGSSAGGLEVGYNRRYNRLVRRACERLAAESGPFTITCVVRGVPLESDHWYYWPNQGTRVTDFSHWFDLAIFLMGKGAEPVTVSVFPAGQERVLYGEELTIVVGFDDGSVLSIVATKRGDHERGVQELVDARRGSTTVLIDDLWRMKVSRDGRERTSRMLWRDKGHQAMYRETIHRFAKGEGSRYPMRDVVAVSVIQLACAQLLREGGAARRLDGELAGLLRRVTR